MAVAVRHQLVRLLRRRIETDRVIDVVVDRERHLRVRPIDGARRGKNKVLDAGLPASLQDVAESDEVGIDVGSRVLQRVADARLRTHVDDRLRSLHAEEARHSRAVCQIEAMEAEARVARQLGEPCLLQPGIVVVVEVVETDHLVAARQEELADVESDEPGGAGDEDAAHDGGAPLTMPSV
jgi:hypothetical protein